MKGLSFNAMRVGWKYRLVNFGDVYEFEVLKPLEKDNFRLKDLSTLEEYNLHDLVQFGKGKDFEVREIE
ncbi:MAG: hypothetical protein MJA30_23220 [Cytophagales bacterium]|nr:hypothetical protein [Cytophagales bacterium]